MKQYFEKLHTFSFDTTKLVEEYRVAALAENSTGNRYIRTKINYSIDPSQGHSTYKPELIVSSFKDSYTQEVVSEITNWLLSTYNVGVTKIKHAALKSKQTLPTHIDNNYTERYHLTIQVNDMCSMTLDGTVYPMIENCTLYRMLASVPHSASNMGNDTRLLITFDIAETGDV